jgi:zinc protease
MSRIVFGVGCRAFGALFVLSFVASLIAQLPGAVARELVANVETFELANGMQVVVIPDQRSPVVTHMVWYRVGSADEAPGESGLAHFLEHLMFRGTLSVAPNQYSVIIARHGGAHNAITNFDYTYYYQRVARDLLPLIMELEADRMANLLLRAEEVLPERDVVMEERRLRVDNDPGSRLAEQMNATFYLSHPYGSPVIGWLHEIERLSQESARAFYDKYYAPNNAILVVAGGVTADEVRALAETHYGPLPANPAITARERPAEAPHQAAIRVEMTDPLASLTIFVRRYLIPSYSTATDGEAHALQVLGQLLGGSTTSRLYRTFVLDQGMATTAGTSGSTGGLDSGEFIVFGVLAPGVAVDTFEDQMDAVIAQLLSDGVTDAEVDDAKRILVANAIFAADDQEGLATLFGQSLVTGQTVEDVQMWPERMEAVTRQQVEEVARRYLRIESSITGVLSPAAAAPQ